MPITTPIADTSRQEPHLDAVLRRRIARLGMWIFITSEMLFFGGLFAAYFHGRIQWPEGFAAAGRHTSVLLGTVNTAVLLTSSLLVALAVEAAAHGRRKLVPAMLAGTLALGLVFLTIKGMEWHAEWREGLLPGPHFPLAQPGAQVFFMLYFTATGLHALHMLAGIAAVSLFAWHAIRGQADWMRSSRLETMALYWHFVDVVWIVLYPLLYLMGRHA